MKNIVPVATILVMTWACSNEAIPKRERSSNSQQNVTIDDNNNSLNQNDPSSGDANSPSNTVPSSENKEGIYLDLGSIASVPKLDSSKIQIGESLKLEWKKAPDTETAPPKSPPTGAPLFKPEKSSVHENYMVIAFTKTLNTDYYKVEWKSSNGSSYTFNAHRKSNNNCQIQNIDTSAGNYVTVTGCNAYGCSKNSMIVGPLYR